MKLNLINFCKENVLCFLAIYTVSGHRGNQWSSITYRVGKHNNYGLVLSDLLHVYYIDFLFSSCSIYSQPGSLWGTQRVQHPKASQCLVSKKRSKGSNLEGPGGIQKRLSESYKEYQACSDFWWSEGGHEGFMEQPKWRAGRSRYDQCWDANTAGCVWHSQ